VSVFYSVLIARVLGPELRGVYFLLQTYQGLGVALLGLSVDTIMTVVLSRKEFDVNEINSAALIFSLALGSIAGAAGYLAFALEGTPALISPFCVILFFLASPFVLYKTMWNSIILGLTEINVLNWVSLLDVLSLALLTIAFVGLIRLSINGLVIAFVLNSFLILLLRLTILLKKFRLKWRISRRCLKELLRLAWRQHLAVIAYNLFTRADALILATLSTTANLGYYSVAKGLTSNISLAVNPVTQVMFPHISAAERGISKGYTVMLVKTIFAVLSLISVAFYFMSPWLITTLYGSAYELSIEHSRILIFALAFLLVQVPISLWFLGNLKKPALNGYVNVTTLILILVLGSLGTKYLGTYGISWGILCSYVFSTAVALVLAHCNSLPLRSVLLKRSDLQKMISFLKFSRFHIQNSGSDPR